MGLYCSGIYEVRSGISTQRGKKDKVVSFSEVIVLSTQI